LITGSGSKRAARSRGRLTKYQTPRFCGVFCFDHGFGARCGLRAPVVASRSTKHPGFAGCFALITGSGSKRAARSRGRLTKYQTPRFCGVFCLIS